MSNMVLRDASASKNEDKVRQGKDVGWCLLKKNFPTMWANVVLKLWSVMCAPKQQLIRAQIALGAQMAKLNKLRNRKWFRTKESVKIKRSKNCLVFLHVDTSPCRSCNPSRKNWSLRRFETETPVGEKVVKCFEKEKSEKSTYHQLQKDTRSEN